MKKHYLIFIAALLILPGCFRSKEQPYNIPNNATKLIADISGKTWKIAKRYNNGTRMNMGDCFLSYRITYRSDLTFNDNNQDYENCGVSMLGNWEVTKDKKGNSYIKITSDQIPELMNMDRNYKYFKILHLTKDTLKLQFRHKQFSNTKTTIIDTFVPEGVKVKDRDFHW